MDAYILGVTFHSHLNISSFNTASIQSWRAKGWCWFLYVVFHCPLTPAFCFKWGRVKIDESSALSSRRVDECLSSELALLFGSQYYSTNIKVWSKTKIPIFQLYQNVFFFFEIFRHISILDLVIYMVHYFSKSLLVIICWSLNRILLIVITYYYYYLSDLADEFYPKQHVFYQVHAFPGIQTHDFVLPLHN